MTTRIFLASTLYGTATLAAAVDAGCFAPAGRTILLLSNNAQNPETTPGPADMPGFGRLRARFDEVRSWNEAIAPFHPGSWTPQPDDLPLWERYLRLLWELPPDEEVELVAESVQVVPALAVTTIFTGARVDLYADGLMSYGPTRNKLDPLLGTRIERLLHLDLVPGLRPLLLTEFDVPQELVPTPAFLKVLAELAQDAPETGPLPEGSALLLGQYLSALGILDADEEEELHVRMLGGAVGLGHRRVVFKPHPTAPARFSRRLEEEAERLGVELTVLEVPLLAEVLFQRLRPALVVGCFSTALLTAASCYGLPVARTGTELLLDRLSPYENSNRVPVTLVDALLPELADRPAVQAQVLDAEAAQLPPLLAAVGFAMQPKIYPGLRPAAEVFLAAHLEDHARRYFKRRRLTSLALPGGVPEQLGFLPRNATVRKVAKRARALKRRAVRG